MSVSLIGAEDGERLEGGVGGHRPREAGHAEVCRGAGSDPSLDVARAGQ